MEQKNQTTTFSTFVQTWANVAEQHPKEAKQVSRHAQDLLAMDRITPQGVEQALKSQEMDRLVELFERELALREALGLTSSNRRTILAAIDLYAAGILFNYEHKH